MPARFWNFKARDERAQPERVEVRERQDLRDDRKIFVQEWDVVIFVEEGNARAEKRTDHDGGDE